MEWKDEYSLGILEIDNQHKLLMNAFSGIEESITLDLGWSNTHYAIVDLIKIAHMHFAFEEALMRMFGYPGSDAHQKEHRSFFDKLENIERLALKETAKIEIVEFMQNWLASHILVNDRGYAKHIFSGAQLVRSGRLPI
ncbi:MAG: bacteriohemerythrin [Gallionella sp.]